jgi:O-antigen/teichoic acid export membrane protein
MDSDSLFLLKKRAVSGVIALTSRTFILQLISLISLSMIGVFLQPSEVGIYVAVTSIMRIISFFTDFGFGAAIVQKKEEIESEEVETAFTIQSLVTALIFLFFLGFKENLDTIFHIGNGGQQLLVVLIFTLFLSSFKTIPSVMLERKIKFDRIIIPQIVESLVFNIVLIILAVNKFGIASYTWATLLSSLAGIPIYYYICPWRVRFGISFKALQMLLYGVMFQAKGILGTIKDDLLTAFLVATKLVDFGALGLIGWWQRWAFFSFRFFVDSVTKVSFSMYSRMQNDKMVLKEVLERSLYITSLLMFPVLSGLIVTAPYFISLIPKYHKWEAGLLTFTFFCLNAAVSSLSNILITTLDAVGYVRTTLKLMVFWTVLTWVLTPIFILWFGFNGVAFASFIITLTIFITVYLVKKIVEFNFFNSFKKPLFSSILMSFVVFFLNKFFVSNIFSLFLVIALGVICYLSFIWIISKKELNNFLLSLKKTYSQ